MKDAPNNGASIVRFASHCETSVMKGGCAHHAMTRKVMVMATRCAGYNRARRLTENPYQSRPEADQIITNPEIMKNRLTPR